MKIPKQVKIGAHIYTVKYEKNLAFNHGAVAQSRHNAGDIIIDPEQTDSQLIDSLLHEILHCINRQVKFVAQDREIEEDAVNRLASALTAVLKDNNLLK